jgi:hypothetical protein
LWNVAVYIVLSRHLPAVKHFRSTIKNHFRRLKLNTLSGLKSSTQNVKKNTIVQVPPEKANNNARSEEETEEEEEKEEEEEDLHPPQLKYG